MVEILLVVVIILLLVNLLFQLTKKGSGGHLESSIKDEFIRNREESNKNSKDTREELSNSFKNLGDSVLNLMKSNNDTLDKMTQTIESKLKSIHDDNNQKLEQMRETVDEKLHKTLEKRLGESFKIVSERLEMVHKGLGEMQTLAAGVGDLKKVLSNVKTRGILGEIQLGNILEEILTPEQYAKNVKTKKDSKENVEFAIKLPGKDDTGQVVYLPLDSKFPLENYHSLVDAYEKGDSSEVERTGKLLEDSIKKCAREIRYKYIDPPNTTDFGIMFLPIEGLYAEVVKRPELIGTLQRDFRIIIAGPTTLAAMLNSLQMGFRTLAIEKHSSEVWKILGAVKTEFEKFGGGLKKAQEKIKGAGEDIDELVGVRTRQIQRKLRDVENLPAKDSTLHIEETSEDDDE